MCKKAYPTLVVGIAVILAILAVVIPQIIQPYLNAALRFFEVLLPLLAVGALLKYIACGGHHHSGCCCKKCTPSHCGTEHGADKAGCHDHQH